MHTYSASSEKSIWVYCLACKDIVNRKAFPNVSSLLNLELLHNMLS
jgi:hypothetical protein